MSRSCAWMFHDWPEGTLGRQVQILNMACLRFGTVLAFKPIRKLLAALAPAVPDETRN